ncbi:transmembrane anterior posterior transformation protein 1 homolog [Styela clava]
MAGMSFMQYFSREVTHGYFFDENDSRYTERRQRVYTFLKQPIEIEKMMTYGFFLCLDVFLYMFTLLPLRIGLAFFQLIGAVFCCRGWSRTAVLDPAQKCDILKALIFVITVYMMSYIDTSFIYHLVRAQTLIKLYIIYNMLEVADRLFSSFGQDILDALFWTATEAQRDNFFRILLHIALAVIYVFCHAVLVLFEATTINCAFNSHNKVLLTVMMANNFVEIKGTVFKKYDKNNLFQISCSDVRERFHYYALLFVVLLRNMQQYSWSSDHLAEILPHMATVIFSEYLVDWFKHAFVLKFNHIPIESYNEYKTTLAYDLISSRQHDSISDHCDVLSRRMGFIPLPLAVLLFHITRISVDFRGSAGVIVIAMGVLILNLIKILNNIILMGKASKYISEDLAIARKMDSEVSVVDPFEQRGGKTILVERSKRPKPTASVPATTAGTIIKKSSDGLPLPKESKSITDIAVPINSTYEGNGNMQVKPLGYGDAYTNSDDEYTLRRRHTTHGEGDVENTRSMTPNFEPSVAVVDRQVESLQDPIYQQSPVITTPAKERSMRPPSIDMTMISSAASLTNLTSLDCEDSPTIPNNNMTRNSSASSDSRSISPQSSFNIDSETIAEDTILSSRTLSGTDDTEVN